jgi:hypothetical protein
LTLSKSPSFDLYPVTFKVWLRRLSMPVRKPDTVPPMEWIIVNIDWETDVDGSALYWSPEGDWGSRENAQVYADEERSPFELPESGRWTEADHCQAQPFCRAAGAAGPHPVSFILRILSPEHAAANVPERRLCEECAAESAKGLIFTGHGVTVSPAGAPLRSLKADVGIPGDLSRPSALAAEPA